ncbi:VirB4 family type IV secretion/conjugal transfer ATPase [Cupriavidus necator]
MTLSDLLRRQPTIEEKLPPIGMPVSPYLTSYDDERLLLVVRLDGMLFESVKDTTLEQAYDDRNAVLAGLAMDKGNRLAIWTTIKRRRARLADAYAFDSPFMRGFGPKYLARFQDQDYFENSFYLSMLLKVDDLDEGCIELEDLGQSVMKSLQGYGPERLGVELHRDVLFSEPFAFLGELINGVASRVPVTGASGRTLLPSSQLHFGYDVVEIRSDATTRFASCYDLKDLPDCGWGQFDALLALPAEFTITQSFHCLGNYAAQSLIARQANKLASAGDMATEQIAELNHAQGQVSGRTLAFGDYHGALVVYGDTARDARDRGELVVARSLNECGVRWVKASLSAPVTYWSQIPGHRHRPRPSLKSTRNLAATFSMHNYACGKARGNPLGDGSAVLPLHTVGQGLYHFNFHASRVDTDNTGEKVAGHTTILGATGAGKTVLQLTLLGFLERFTPKIFALDLDRGMEIFLRNLGGLYYPLKAGEPTGIAPFELPDTPGTRDFLYDLVAVCGRDANGRVSAEELQQIKVAVDTVYRIDDVAERCFSRLLETIPLQGGNCLATRLGQWCHAAEGRYAWALDNAPGSMPDVAHARRIGFDVTDFLKAGYAPAEPVLAYLLFLKDRMQAQGGLLATIVEEFWLPAQFEITQKMIFKALKTGRKAEEFMVLVSQSPEDAIASPIWPALRDQCPTKIYLPNRDAEYESYQRCNLTEKEFAELKRLSLDSRTFLIKQNGQSVFAKLDLYGMWDELAVLSGSPDNVAIWESVWQQHGPDLEACMTHFQAARQGKRASTLIPSNTDGDL